MDNVPGAHSFCTVIKSFTCRMNFFPFVLSITRIFLTIFTIFIFICLKHYGFIADYDCLIGILNQSLHILSERMQKDIRSNRVELGYRIKANCRLVGPVPVGEVAFMGGGGVFLRDPSPYSSE